ncbi:MAG: hypothetical protein AAF799_48140 [Myxococcota bacterium]
MRPLIGLALGVLLGLGACDEEPPPETTCADWLRCYSSCRDEQYARGDDQALTQDDLHQLCVSECIDIANEVDPWPTDLDQVMKNPEDVGFLWERLTFCLTDGA